MADLLRPSFATNAAGCLPGTFDFQLDEEFLPIRSINAPCHTLDALLPMGNLRKTVDGIILRLWPDSVWTTFEPADLSDARTVDISHCYTLLRLRGADALHFLNNYTYADLISEPARQAQVIRTRLSHYDCVLWWESISDVCICVERSLAQSFCDTLRNLVVRHVSKD